MGEGIVREGESDGGVQVRLHGYSVQAGRAHDGTTG